MNTPAPLSPSPSDEQLIQRSRQGDTDAFGQFVDRHADMVFAIAFARLRNRDRAEDLMQEVFLRTYLHIESIRDTTQPARWLSRVTRNLAITALRSDQRSSKLLKMIQIEAEPAATQQPDPRPTRAAMDDQDAELAALNDALGQLPEDDREIVALHYLQGLTHPEIADRLGTHRTTVARRLDRALASLRTSLRPPTPQRPFPGLRPAARTTAIGIAALVSALPQKTRASLLIQTADTATLATKSSIATTTSTATIAVTTGTVLMSFATKALVGTAVVTAIAFGAYYTHNKSTANSPAGKKADKEMAYETGQEVNLSIPTGQRHRLLPKPQQIQNPKFADYVPDYKQIDLVALPNGRLRLETINRTTGKVDIQEVGPTADAKSQSDTITNFQIWEEMNRAAAHSLYVRQTTTGVTVNLYSFNKPLLLPEFKAIEKEGDAGRISKSQVNERAMAILERENLLPTDPDNRKLFGRFFYGKW